MKKLLLHITLVLLVVSATAQGSLRATLDSSQSTVATPFTLTVEASIPGADNIQLQPFPKEDSSGFLFLKSEAIESTNKGGVLSWKAKLWLIGMKEGLSEIPPLKATFSGGGTTADIVSNPLQITLNPSVVDTTSDLKPIIEPRDAPYTVREFLPYIILALLLGAIGFLFWYFWQKRKQPELDITAELPPEPPIVIAQKKLEICRKKALWKQEQYKAHYSAVTEILREYIENRLGLPALESTSFETVHMLKKSSLDKESISQLAAFFEEADLVKFAKEPATEASSVALLDQAERWLGAVHEKLDPVVETGGDDD